MLKIRNKIFKIKESVDIYKVGEDILYFYFINSRNKFNLEVSEEIIKLIASINGEKSLNQILEELCLEYNDNLDELLKYLLNKKIIYIPVENINNVLNENEKQRYDRQLSFFDNFFEEDKNLLQKKLKEEVFLIFGAGAIGSGIAIELAMCGVENFILVDKKSLMKSNMTRHYYYSENKVGQAKVDVLKDYLKRINKKINVRTYNDSINFSTDLNKYFDEKITFIVNTLDEPYIGFTSMKIGRKCFKENKPLFVGGGFDAHLMSTGELIIPNITPCVDCYVDHFTSTLKGWKPSYNSDSITNENLDQELFEVGGLSSMSLFSVSYGVIEILKYILSKKIKILGRGELKFENLNVEYINVEKNKNCKICGDNKNDI